ncbi:MAG TPA: hypothetical protein PLW83_08605, partial [Deltaproteobacteria bacterium]|nr:hypothetical protein [Deltaproteobacteria bacterium]
MNFDDPPYVTHNPHVLKGITAEGFRWAFTSVYGSNWHPLTWISHMLDVELFGMNAGMHHLTNTLLHALNSVLLFLVLEAATKARGKSALVALLFAVHPLHVESVAWVAERKDVLSTFFGMLATAAYIAYANRPSAWRYLVVAIAFVLGLMAKPMLVTLPLVLIILDFWPLERILPDGKRPDAAARPEGGMPRLPLSRLILEKAPLFALSAASSAVTVYAQYTGGSVRTLDEIPLYQRTANAIVSYVMYLVKTAVPSGLAAFYPFPEAIPAAKVIACGVFLAGVTAAAWALRKRRPYLIAGWLWYVVTLVPVIGLVQVGRQSMADRYTYLPLVGIFVIVVWGADDVLKRFTRSTKPAAALAAIGLAVLMTATYFQVGVWKDSTALFSHAVAVTQGNYIAHYNLGCELQKQGDTGEAI